MSTKTTTITKEYDEKGMLVREVVVETFEKDADAPEPTE